MFLKWSGSSSSSDGIFSGRRQPSQQKSKALTSESESLYKGSPLLLQENTKALTVEGDPLLILKSTQLTARNL